MQLDFVPFAANIKLQVNKFGQFWSSSINGLGFRNGIKSMPEVHPDMERNH
jgi:hypothetical protein